MLRDGDDDGDDEDVNRKRSARGEIWSERYDDDECDDTRRRRHPHARERDFRLLFRVPFRSSSYPRSSYCLKIV